MTPSILLTTGVHFNFLTPEESAFCIMDVASGLANTCRFAGHTGYFYSVAQHSVLVSHLVPAEHALYGLMHDAHEAFIGDMTSPLKSLLPDYQALEKKIEKVVLAKFGLSGPKPAEVKQADLIALATEKRDLMPHDAEVWTILDDIKPNELVIVPQLPDVARAAFLDRYIELTREA